MKITIILLTMIILLSSFISAALIDSQTSYWKFDGDTIDSVGSDDFQNNGLAATSAGFINQAYNYSANSYMNTSADLFSGLTAPRTYSIWFKTDVLDSAKHNIWYDNTFDGLIRLRIQGDNKLNVYFYNSGGANLVGTPGVLTVDQWYHVVILYDGDVGFMYLDNSQVGNTGSIGSLVTSGPIGQLSVGATTSASSKFDGVIDEFGIWSRNITEAEISSLYNSGAGFQYPYAGSVTPTISNVNCTSPEPDVTGMETGTRCWSNDDTNTIVLNTDVASTCGVSNTNSSYTNCTTTGGTSHTCTYPSSQGEGTVTGYLNCTVDNSNTLALNFFIKTTNPDIVFNTPSSQQYVDKLWVEVNVTATDIVNVNNISIYSNGILIATNTTPINNTEWIYNLTVASVGNYSVYFKAWDNVSTYNSNTTETRWYDFVNLNTGLVSYYSFNNNADDEIGTNDGTITGATKTASGKVFGAYSYDGINDYVDLGQAWGNFSNNNFTISMWVRVHNDGTYDTFISKGLWGTDEFIFYKQNDVNNAVYINDKLIVENWGVPDYDWMLYTLTKNSTIYKLYWNNTLVQTNSTTTEIINNSKKWIIGAANDGVERFLNGTIDELGIWNRALTFGEINYFYNNGDGRTLGSGPGNLTLGGKATDRNAELGSRVELVGNIPDDTVWLDIDHYAYGVNYTSSAGTVGVNLTVNTFRKTTFNDSTSAKNITFTTGTLENETVYFRMHQHDEIEDFTFNITGFTAGGSKPASVKIYINDLISNNLGDVFSNFITKFNNEFTTDNTTYTTAATEIATYIKLYSGTTVVSGLLNVSGYNSTTRQVIATTDGSTGTFAEAASKADDADYDTYSTTDAGINSSIFWNYTKPTGVLSASSFEIKDFVSRVNLSIPSDCWSQSPLQFRSDFFSDSGNVIAEFDSSGTDSSKWTIGHSSIKIRNCYVQNEGWPEFDISCIEQNTVNGYEIVYNEDIDLSSYTDTDISVKFRGRFDDATKTEKIQLGISCNSGVDWTWLGKLEETPEDTWVTKSSDISDTCGSNPATFRMKVYFVTGSPSYAYVKDFFITAEPFTNVSWACYNGTTWNDLRENQYSGSSANTLAKVYEQDINWIAYPNDAWMEIGVINGTREWNYTGEFKTANSQSTDFTTELNDYLSTCEIDDDNFCSVPIYLYSGSTGRLMLKDLSVEYTSDVNPINLNEQYFQSYLLTQSEFTDVPVTFESSQNGTIQIDDVKMNYRGGNKTYTITAHNNDSSITISHDLTYYHSRWNYSFPYRIDYFEIIPQRYNSLNVTPYGQTTTVPILNMTALNYGGLSFNFTFYNTVISGNTTAQETQDEYSTSTTTWNTTYPLSNFFDGNYSTFTLDEEGSSGDSIVEYYYTKPIRASNNSLWQVKDESGTVNLTIPINCWTQNRLRFQTRSNLGTPVIFTMWSCYDGEAWDSLRIAYVGPKIYEETMFFDILSPATDINLSINNVSSKPSTPLTINTWEKVINEQDYLDNFGMWYWADFNRDLSGWDLWQPLYSFRACCNGCICSEDRE